MDAICRHRGGSCARDKALRTALSLAPENPRVQLISALCHDDAEHTDAASVAMLRTVVASFEAAPPSRPGQPDWGQAEALVMLGESYLLRGDPVAARDVIERALVLAPDYRKARRLLQPATNRPK